MEVVFGILGGIGVFILIFLLVAPAFVSAGLFVNTPGETTRSGIHFFTFIEQGEIKFVVRGDNIVRAIMNTSGKKFAKIGTTQDESFYKMIDGTPEDPTSYVWWLLRPWASYVYKTTGAVFTGVYPFQRIREKELERTKIIRTEILDADGKKEENLKLEVVTDFSDHFRLRRFLFNVHVIGAETKDKIPVDFLFVMECETNNPFVAAFGIDRWENALTNYATDRLTLKTRTMTLDQILTADDIKMSGLLKKAIVTGTHPQKEIGVTIRTVTFLKSEPRVTPEELLKLRAEAFAIQTAKATRIDGRARADNLRDLNKANEEGGVYALATLEAETRVRTAAAAGAKGLVIMTSSDAKIDPVAAAQLRALEEKNTKGEN